MIRIALAAWWHRRVLRHTITVRGTESLLVDIVAQCSCGTDWVY